MKARVTLRRALFFLERAQDYEPIDGNQIIPEEYISYLEASIVFAHLVSVHLELEYGKANYYRGSEKQRRGYEGAFLRWFRTFERDEHFIFFQEHRNRILHDEPARIVERYSDEPQRYVFEPGLAVVQDHLHGLDEVLNTFPSMLDSALRTQSNQ